MEKRIIAIGDIHGCYHTLETLLNKVEAAKSDKIVLLGDYIDRGPSSKEVIDLIINLIDKGYNIIPLKGNHESMLLNTLSNPKTYSTWLFNGGNETLKSFKAATISDIPVKYHNFFNSLKYYSIQYKYHFVHAGFNEDSTDTFTDLTAMLWSRKENYSSLYFKNKLIVHGHTPIALIELNNLITNNSSVINVDTGCVYALRNGMGHLSAIEFPNRKVFSVKNIDMPIL